MMNLFKKKKEKEKIQKGKKKVKTLNRYFL